MEKAVNKKAAACCNKRAADRAKELAWLDSVLLVEFEKKLLDVLDGKSGFFGGENYGDFAVGRIVLSDYDVTFCADVNLCPVAWGDGECGVHAFTIQVSVRGGKVVSYAVRGNEPRQVYGRVFPNR